MEKESQATSFFARQRFVLVQTSHPGNVGAAARAIKTMGFGRLVLVQPLQNDIQSDPIAIAMASGADDILAQAQVVDSIDLALMGCHLTIALSARAREFGPMRCRPRHAAAMASETLAAHADAEVAWVFGNERYGLPNEIVERCGLLTAISANPAYTSLNLAQAVQLLAYEARLALPEEALRHEGANLTTPTVGFSGKPARDEQVAAMFVHLEQALVALEFLNPAQPKKLMARVRRLLLRSPLEEEEVNILRGIARAILLRVK